MKSEEAGKQPTSKTGGILRHAPNSLASVLSNHLKFMRYHRLLTGLAGCFLILNLTAIRAQADITRVQTIQLQPGWNSIFLEVDPLDPKPSDLFQGTPVTIVAAYTAVDKSVQYVQNPSTNSLTQRNGWDVWYSPSRPDAFLTRLFTLNGNKPYLLYSQSNYTWNVTGNALLTSVKWKPNSYTLAGFCVDSVSPPTFDQFFKGSPNHKPYQVYRLVNGQWFKMDSAQTTQMRSGEACWIYCQGSSDYQGPLYTKLSGSLTFPLNGANPSGLTLMNNSPNPLGVQVLNVAGGAQLPLGFQLRAVTDTNVVTATYDLPDNYNLPSFDAAEKRGLWLVLRSEKMSAATQTGLLKITTDLGTINWVPVTGNRSSETTSN
jgi:hypothetical protein